MPAISRRLLAAGAGVMSLAVAAAVVPAAFADQDAGPAADVTSVLERNRVDGVPAPAPNWKPCKDGAECATVRVPVDYDEPDGATTGLSVLRVTARDPQHRIGSLFLNPGGPGVSATKAVAGMSASFGDEVRDRFDIVGFDPRGVGSSGKIRCFPSADEQVAAISPLFDPLPLTRAEEADTTRAAQALGKACADNAATLAGSMSTAEAARDMDVLRRMVGDEKLTYLGFSYGSALGEYYAAMFPDRVRAVAIDGVIDPQAWAGTPETADRLPADRQRQADGSYRALLELLTRCDRAGEQFCPFAAGDPSARFDQITERLRRQPVEVGDGAETWTLTYAAFVGEVQGALYSRTAGDDIAAMAAEAWAAIGADGGSPADSPELAERLKTPDRVTALAADLPYDSTVEMVSAVSCTDGLFPADVASWPALTAAADQRAPYFGRAWGWRDVPCAGNAWTVRDEDAYRGPFNRRTADPVLVVGSLWDPVTGYDEAVATAKLLTGSRLLTSTNWGHTAYGTSGCATGAIDGYLTSQVLPAEGTVCEGDQQPFRTPLR